MENNTTSKPLNLELGFRELSSKDPSNSLYACPYPIVEGFSADKLNTLFVLLFKNKANRQIQSYDNINTDTLKKVMKNYEMAINKFDNNVYLCVNVDGKIYRLQLTTDS